VAEHPSLPPRLPARTPQEARNRYTAFLQKTLSCISHSVWQVGPPAGATDEEWVLFLPQLKPLNLKAEGHERVTLHATQRFVVVDDPKYPGEFKTSTRQYIYRVSGKAQREPVLSWHWHPSNSPGKREPHAHVASQEWTAWGRGPIEKLHIPTERTAFESIVLFLIEDLNVQPARDDWRDILDESLRAFRRFRSWPSATHGLSGSESTGT
jgi:hypothetical protein